VPDRAAADDGGPVVELERAELTEPEAGEEAAQVERVEA